MRPTKKRRKAVIWPLLVIIALLVLILAALLLMLFKVQQRKEIKPPDPILPMAEENDPTALLGETYEGMEGLYVLNHGDEFGPWDYILNIEMSSGRMLISYSFNQEVHAALYDFEKGDFLADVSLGYKLAPDGDFEESQGEYEEGYFSFGLETCGDSLYYAVQGDVVCFYDSELSLFARSAQQEEGLSYSGGEGYVMASSSENQLLLIYPDGSERTFALGNVGYVYPIYGDSDSVWLFGMNEWYDNIFTVCDISTGEVASSGILETASIQGGDWLWTGETYYSMADLGCAFNASFGENESLRVVLSDSAVTTQTDSGDVTLTRYDLESGGAVCLTIPGAVHDYLWIGDAIAEWEDYLIFMLYVGDEERLLVWQPDEELETSSSVVMTAEGLSGGVEMLGLSASEYYAKEYESADQVLEEYRVGLYYSNLVTETEFYDYSVEACSDTDSLEAGISAVTAVLDAMPEGFVEQVIYPWKGLDIYLTATISPIAEGSIGNAAAFTTTLDENRAAIVLDVTGGYEESLKQNFAHEFMHLIELTIVKNYNMQLFLSWEDFNPEGFSYTYSYLTESGETMDSWNSPEYTSEAEDDVTESYFIDGYAKTFPNEDRARLFENLFVDNNSAWWLESSHLRAKAEYLCQCLRENFSSLKNAENICWERVLE